MLVLVCFFVSGKCQGISKFHVAGNPADHVDMLSRLLIHINTCTVMKHEFHSPCTAAHPILQ
jgi:hypothetical protein